MKTLKTILLGLTGLLIVGACGSSRELQTVDEVDLNRYEGLWYDIAHLPQDFQDDCKCVTAEYRKVDGHVKVVNTCVDEENGDTSIAEAKAFPVNGSNNSKLKVQFFWPFKGDYYVIALEENYRYAMVGSPDRESLWIISRTYAPAATILKDYLNKAENLGFDTSKLVYTDQSCYAEPTPSSQ